MIFTKLSLSRHFYIYLFIYSGYFYSASSSPLLLRCSPESRPSTDSVSEFHAEAPQATVSEGLAQGPYVSAIERYSNPRLFGRKALTLPMGHHAPHE